MKRDRIQNFFVVLIGVITLCLAACSDAAPEEAASAKANHSIAGKADGGFGSCEGQCGVAPGEAMDCACDPGCVDEGDCCDDYSHWCVEIAEDDRAACEATRGAWLGDFCECENGDGEDVGRVFLGGIGCVTPIEVCGRSGGVWADADERCVYPSDLCEDTGGDWVGGLERCDCQHFVWLAGQGCVAPETAYGELGNDFFDEARPFDAADYVSADIGVFFITRAGALQEVFHYDDAADLPIKDLTDDLFCPMNYDSVTFDASLGDAWDACGYFVDTDGYPIDGCFLESAGLELYGRLSRLMTDMNEFWGEVMFDDDQLAAAGVVELAVNAKVTVTMEKLTLYFGDVDGAVRLLVVEEADCLDP